MGVIFILLHNVLIQPIILLLISIIETIFQFSKLSVYKQTRKYLFICNKLIAIFILSIYLLTRILY
jgi:hypothetical protein